MLTRITPTPSGFLHEGNLFNILFITHWAQANKAKVLLRLDDFDTPRVRDVYINDIFSKLQWLGVEYDLGPRDLKTHNSSYSQSLRKDAFFEIAIRLLKEGKAYACDCSRSELKKAGHSHYPGLCQNKGLKFDVGVNSLRFCNSSGEDFILWRKDDLPSYQLVSVAEDIKDGVSHVIRGEDLKESTEFQKSLLSALGVRTRPVFFHHPQILGKSGEKLSKSVRDGEDLHRKFDKSLSGGKEFHQYFMEQVFRQFDSDFVSNKMLCDPFFVNITSKFK